MPTRPGCTTVSQGAVVQDRNGATVRGKHILHVTLCRDYVCGECGSRLVTLARQNYEERRTDWLTVCANDHGHDADSFITSAAWEYRQVEAQMEAAEAQDIFNHLPAEMQAMITKGENDGN